MSAYTDEDVERVAFQLYRMAGGMDWPRMSSASDREFYAPRAEAILADCSPAIAARALREFAASLDYHSALAAIERADEIEANR